MLESTTALIVPALNSRRVEIAGVEFRQDLARQPQLSLLWWTWYLQRKQRFLNNKNMAKGKEVDATPARPAPALKRQSSSAVSSKNQASIMGFFSKTPNTARTVSQSSAASTPSASAIAKPTRKTSLFPKTAGKSTNTAIPSSDANQESDDDRVSAKV